jgi:hypothetical protein
MFVIEDEIHVEWCGEFKIYEEALSELQDRIRISWDSAPNIYPCMSWRTCGRKYCILEFDSSLEPWREVFRTHVLSVSSKGTLWEKEFDSHANA